MDRAQKWLPTPPNGQETARKFIHTTVASERFHSSAHGVGWWCACDRVSFRRTQANLGAVVVVRLGRGTFVRAVSSSEAVCTLGIDSVVASFVDPVGCVLIVAPAQLLV